MDLEIKLVPEYAQREEYAVLKKARKQFEELEQRHQMISLFGTDSDDRLGGSDEERGGNPSKQRPRNPTHANGEEE